MNLTASTPASTVPRYDARHDQHFGVTDITFGFLPAFQDPLTGETHLSVYPDGQIAVVHLLDNIPAHWVEERDDRGRPISLKDGIIAGFIRNDQFFTHHELANTISDA